MSYVNYQQERSSALAGYIEALMRYRFLCWNLVWSDIRTRFRRSYFGVLWAVMQPLGYSLIIAWAWGTLFDPKGDYWQFAVYVFAGMLVWEYFTNTVNNSLEALINATGYLRQSRVPFLIFQVRIPLTGAVIFAFGIIGLAILMAVLEMAGVKHFPLTPHGAEGFAADTSAIGLHTLLVLPYMLFLLAFMTPLAITASVLGAQFRDLKHITHLAIQALFFLSPVMFPRGNMARGHLAILEVANPMVPMIDMFRDPVIYGRFWEAKDVIVVSIWTAALWLLAMIVAASAGRRIVFAL